MAYFVISLNEICNPSAWSDPEFIHYFKELNMSTDPSAMHRKNWEWAQTLYGLEKLGLINSQNVALDVGAGREDLLYYFANEIKKIYGTDLYEDEPSDEKYVTAPKDMLTDPKKYAPFPYKEENLIIMKMDGRNLDFDDNYFDFVFSISSIEHFGSHEGSMESMKEIGRVLKVGGVAAIVTECVLNNKTHHEYFTPKELDSFLIKPSKLELIEPIKFQQPSLEPYIEKPLKLPQEANSFPHFVLDSNGTIFTSVMMFLKKPSFSS